MTVVLIQNAVIAGVVRADYSAPAGVLGSWQIDAPGHVEACWYVPIDNITDLMKFHHINVTPSNGQITLEFIPNQAAMLRILIFAYISGQ